MRWGAPPHTQNLAQAHHTSRTVVMVIIVNVLGEVVGRSSPVMA